MIASFTIKYANKYHVENRFGYSNSLIFSNYAFRILMSFNFPLPPEFGALKCL
jgi:hypothetical protein